MHSFTLKLATILALSVSRGASASIGSISSRQDGGSLSYDSNSAPFTFDYSTSEPNEKNYIGILAAADADPSERVIDSPSLQWEYAPGTDGSVHIDPEHLEPGKYTAFLLGVFGPDEEPIYLAEPISVTFPGLPSNLSFPVQHASLHNARQNEAYSAHLGGLVLGKGSGEVTFEKLNGDSWINISEDGTLTGTPPPRGTPESKAEIKATADNGSTATIRISIPVRNARQALLDSLAVMSYNLFVGGAQVHDYHEKQLRFILESGADVIGIQEGADFFGQDVSGGNHVDRLARALGWHSWSGNYSVGILSRYPIVEEHPQVHQYSGGVRINLNGDSTDRREINLWNMHTHPDPYGPHEFCFNNASTADVAEVEAGSGRTEQIEQLLAHVEAHLAGSATTPVLLTGDMNAPSHLDWTAALAEKHCGIPDFAWPTSKVPADAGLRDSFRVAHPDPLAEQGLTWSPIHKVDEATGRDEPQDRIDFVYATKELQVISSEALVVGEPRPIPDERENEWTSDHKVVLTRFRLAGSPGNWESW